MWKPAFLLAFLTAFPLCTLTVSLGLGPDISSLSISSTTAIPTTPSPVPTATQPPVDAPIVSIDHDGSNSVITVKVDARKGWQSTHIQLEENVKFSIDVIDGTWTEWQGQSPYTPGLGHGEACTSTFLRERCVEPMPDVPKGMLIGQIGGHLFAIGSRFSSTAEVPGILLLRMNDGDCCLYDNDGILTVKVTVQPG